MRTERVIMSCYTALFYCPILLSRQSVTPVSIKCVEKEKYKLHECGEIIWSRNGTSLELNYVQAAWTEEFIN